MFGHEERVGGVCGARSTKICLYFSQQLSRLSASQMGAVTTRVASADRSATTFKKGSMALAGRADDDVGGDDVTTTTVIRMRMKLPETHCLRVGANPEDARQAQFAKAQFARAALPRDLRRRALACGRTQ